MPSCCVWDDRGLRTSRRGSVSILELMHTITFFYIKKESQIAMRAIWKIYLVCTLNKCLHTSIHLYISYTSYLFEGHGWLEPIPADNGREACYTPNRSPLDHRAPNCTLYVSKFALTRPYVWMVLSSNIWLSRCIAYVSLHISSNIRYNELLRKH